MNFETLQRFFQTAPVSAAPVAESLWMIIALPLLGAVVCGVFGRALGRSNTGLVACAAVAGSFLLSVIVAWVVNDPSVVAPNAYGSDTRYAIGHDYGTWFSAGGFRVNFGLAADHLSASMLLVITGVGFLIHVYSTSYMEHDAGYWRYFAYLNLFVAMMLTLVLADSLVLLFVGWEGVGLCSYLLIGFWYTDAAKAFAGRKAFVTNRIGDFGFLLGMFLLVLLVDAFNLEASKKSFLGRTGDGTGSDVSAAARAGERWRQGLTQKGPLAFDGLKELSRMLPASGAADVVTLQTPIKSGPLADYTFGGVLTAVLLLFLLGAAGKSAQLPLYVWLPDAMAGPTPVSALIHAATMVTSGVYLFCRISWLLVLSPPAMATTALIGGLTALLAAVIAFAQDDIKKVLAYSTVSQLGMMFIGIGTGVFWAAFLHVVTHAFFKACLFLGAGSVMHGNADETDIKKLGGLRGEMRWTWATFLIATLAITGIVPLSGFFSKDAILHGAHTTKIVAFPWATSVAWGLGIVTAACTAFYMVRLYVLTFEGKRSPEAKAPHAHESAWAMVLPLVVLAVLSVVFLAHGIPRPAANGQLKGMIEDYLTPVFALAGRLSHQTGFVETHAGEGLPWGAWGTAWAIALGGGLASYIFYTRVVPEQVRSGKPGPAWARGLRNLAVNKLYVDELYELLVIKPVKFVAFILYRVIDALMIDAVAVRGTAWVTLQVGSALRYLQSGDAQGYAAVMAIALVSGLAYVLARVIS